MLGNGSTLFSREALLYEPVPTRQQAAREKYTPVGRKTHTLAPALRVGGDECRGIQGDTGLWILIAPTQVVPLNLFKAAVRASFTQPNSLAAVSISSATSS